MKDRLEVLHRTRNTIAEIDEKLTDALVHLEKTEEYQRVQQLKEWKKAVQEQSDSVADRIRNDVIREFNRSEDKNKKPYDGIQIKEFQTIEVTDEEEVIKWSIDSGQFALVSLVTSKFNKIAKVLDLPFVTKGTEYRAQIASDLSMYEEKDE